MSYETIAFEQEGPLAIITLRRPERMNALNMQMELHQALRFANLIVPLADAEGRREIKTRQAAFAERSKDVRPT